MAKATSELAGLLAKPPETAEVPDDGPTPMPTRDETPAWRRPFRLAILGLL